MAVNMGSTNSKRPFAITGQVFNIAAVQLNDAWTDFILSRQSMGYTVKAKQRFESHHPLSNSIFLPPTGKFLAPAGLFYFSIT